jgi:hypothetical protein
MRSLLLGIAVLACFVSCRDTAAGGQHARRAQRREVNWQREVAGLISSGSCEEALALLKGIRERQPIWFELASQAHVACWKRSGSSAHAAEAVQVIDEGLARFPTSANLLLSRGYRRRELGEQDAALRDFQAAAEQAAPLCSRRRKGSASRQRRCSSRRRTRSSR